jgi:adenylate cyclase class 2
MQTSTEIEVKFPVSSLTSLRRDLERGDAQIRTPRHLERNWRFDSRDGALTASGRVLRVRKGITDTLTFKERTTQALTRREIEVEISSADQALQLLEGLGYAVVLIYEKYRQVFSLGEVQIMLDELPFGFFVEIEGPDSASLGPMAAELGLAWEAGIAFSYMEIFGRLKQAAGLDVPHLTFSAFEGVELDCLGLLGLMDALAETKSTG